MPYYLNNASSPSAGINIPSVTIGATVGDYIEIKAVANSGNPSNNYRLVGVQSLFANLIEMQPAGILFRANGASATASTGYTQPAVGSIFTIKATKVTSTTWQVSLNGSNLGSPLAVPQNLTIDAIGRFGSSTTEAFRGGFYYIAISTNGGVSATRYYNPASTSSGTVLPDTANSANNGNQVGTWPSDNSEWVFYSSGAYTLTADGATFSYSGGIASTIYNRLLSADGGSFNYSGGVAATLLNRLIASDGATFGHSGGASALLYGRALQADGGSFSYSGGVATFVYNPITGYVLNADGGIFSYAGGEAALSFNQNYPTANPNDYTVSAYLSTDSTYTARLSESSTINAIISASSTFNARLN